MIYLDYNATTPIAVEVADAMLPFINKHFGNPSSSHEYGIKAGEAVETARRQVASLIGAHPSEIIFTSGGSESNNMVIKGAAYSRAHAGKHIITSRIEHPALLNPCKFLEKNGYRVTYLPVDHHGIVSVAELEKAITCETILVSIMHANNETGTIQPVSEIAAICKAGNILFHTDAAQSVGKIPVSVGGLGVDFLSIAGHKVYAPKGIGALYIKDGVNIEPLIHGAGQENGKRAGTENVIFIAGLGKACELAHENRGPTPIANLTNKFLQGLKDIFGNKIRLNGHPEKRLPNTLFVSFPECSLDEIKNALKDVAFSTGSACHSGSTTISPVLKAMGVKSGSALATIRFSTGRFTSEAEIETVLEKLRGLI